MSGKEQEGTQGWTIGETCEGSLCLRPRAAITKRHTLVTENVKNFIPLWFWRPEVQRHSVGRPVLPLEAPGEDPSWPFPALGGNQPSSACRCVAPGLAAVSTGLLSPVSVALYPSFPRLIQSPVTPEVGPIHIEFDLILT